MNATATKPAAKRVFVKWTEQHRINLAKAMARESAPPLYPYGVKKWLLAKQVTIVGMEFKRNSFSDKELNDFIPQIKSFLDIAKNRPSLAGGGLVAVPKKEEPKLTPKQIAEAAFQKEEEEEEEEVTPTTRIAPSAEPHLDSVEIPKFAWWDEKTRDFIQATPGYEGRSRGTLFFDTWFHRRKDFPQSLLEALPPPVPAPAPTVAPIDSSLRADVKALGPKFEALEKKQDDFLQTMLSAQRRQHQELTSFITKKEQTFESAVELISKTLAQQAKHLEDLTLEFMLQKDVLNELGGNLERKKKEQEPQEEKKAPDMTPKANRRVVTVVGCIPKYRDDLERKNPEWKFKWINKGDHNAEIKNKVSGRIVVLVDLFSDKEMISIVRNTSAHFEQVGTPNAISEALKRIPDSVNGGIES